MTLLFTELNRIIFTALYHTFSTSHGIEFTVNDRKIFYGLIPLSFTVCNRINYFFLKSVRMRDILILDPPSQYIMIKKNQSRTQTPPCPCIVQPRRLLSRDSPGSRDLFTGVRMLLVCCFLWGSVPSGTSAESGPPITCLKQGLHPESVCYYNRPHEGFHLANQMSRKLGVFIWISYI